MPRQETLQTELKRLLRTYPETDVMELLIPDVTGVLQLPEGVEMVMPGDNVTIEAELITPIAMEKELRFAVREGGRTVGAGVVSDVVE